MSLEDLKTYKELKRKVEQDIENELKLLELEDKRKNDIEHCDDITTVDISSPKNGDIIVFDGTKWINKPLKPLPLVSGYKK